MAMSMCTITVAAVNAWTALTALSMIPSSLRTSSPSTRLTEHSDKSFRARVGRSRVKTGHTELDSTRANEPQETFRFVHETLKVLPLTPASQEVTLLCTTAHQTPSALLTDPNQNPTRPHPDAI